MRLLWLALAGAAFGVWTACIRMVNTFLPLQFLGIERDAAPDWVEGVVMLALFALWAAGVLLYGRWTQRSSGTTIAMATLGTLGAAAFLIGAVAMVTNSFALIEMVGWVKTVAAIVAPIVFFSFVIEAYGTKDGLRPLAVVAAAYFVLPLPLVTVQRTLIDLNVSIASVLWIFLVGQGLAATAAIVCVRLAGNPRTSRAAAERPGASYAWLGNNYVLTILGLIVCVLSLAELTTLSVASVIRDLYVDAPGIGDAYGTLFTVSNGIVAVVIIVVAAVGRRGLFAPMLWALVAVHALVAVAIVVLPETVIAFGALTSASGLLFVLLVVVGVWLPLGRSAKYGGRMAVAVVAAVAVQLLVPLIAMIIPSGAARIAPIVVLSVISAALARSVYGRFRSANGPTNGTAAMEVVADSLRSAHSRDS